MTEYKNQTISRATHRPQDLIPAFMDLLRDIDAPEYEAYTVGPFPAVPAYVYDEGDDSAWWELEECDYLLADLFDILNSYAPEGFYFGAHPGDGSDFGFWEVEEDV